MNNFEFKRIDDSIHYVTLKEYLPLLKGLILWEDCFFVLPFEPKSTLSLVQRVWLCTHIILGGEDSTFSVANRCQAK